MYSGVAFFSYFRSRSHNNGSIEHYKDDRRDKRSTNVVEVVTHCFESKITFESIKRGTTKVVISMRHVSAMTTANNTCGILNHGSLRCKFHSYSGIYTVLVGYVQRRRRTY